MLDAALVRSYSEFPLVIESVDATREALSAEEVAFIATFARTLTFDDVFLYHGTPRSNMEDLLAITPAERVDEMLDGKRARVLCRRSHAFANAASASRHADREPGLPRQPFEESASGGPR